jgi:hypothetical protein
LLTYHKVDKNMLCKGKAMYMIAIMILLVGVVTTTACKSRSGSSAVRTARIVPPPAQPSQQDLQSQKDDVIKHLNELLGRSVIDDAWHDAVNDLVFELAVLDKILANTYFKKILDKTAQVAVAKVPQSTSISPALPAASVSVPEKTVVSPVSPSASLISGESKNNLIKQLDEKLRSTTIDDAWYEAVDNLIFDLALIDRNVSNEYLKKVHTKIAPVAQASSAVALPSEPMKKGTPPAAPGGGMKQGTPPPPPAGAIKQGTPPPPPGGAMKKGGTPPPPPGPMVKGNKNAVADKKTVTPVAPKGPEPLSVKESYGAAQLKKRTNEEIIALFNNLLEALGSNADFWDAIKKEATLAWKNKIDTVKKALADPERNIQMNAAQLVEERIKQVRADKVKQGLEKQAAAENVVKKTEEEVYSESDLIKQIEALKKKSNISDFKWLIEFQGTVKKLDKINHDKAVEYENDFIKKYPGQKPFLPKKKAVEVKKELTEEEKIITNIDKILEEKIGLWSIKVREPIQELYDIDPTRGLEYQNKYIEEVKKTTGKVDKPFLKLKS